MMADQSLINSSDENDVNKSAYLVFSSKNLTISFSI